jgi:hypothetical protein
LDHVHAIEIDALPGAQPDGPVRGFNLASVGAARRLANTLIWFSMSTEAKGVLLFRIAVVRQ